MDLVTGGMAWHGGVATSPWPSSAVADISPNFLRTLPCTHTKCCRLQRLQLQVINYSQKSKVSGSMASSVIAPGERLLLDLSPTARTVGKELPASSHDACV
jgi:hypothetical protein